MYCFVSPSIFFFLLLFQEPLLTLLFYGFVFFLFSDTEMFVGQHRVARYGGWNDPAAGD